MPLDLRTLGRSQRHGASCRSRVSERAPQSVRVRRLPYGRREHVDSERDESSRDLLHDVTRPVVNFSYAIDRALWGRRRSASTSPTCCCTCSTSSCCFIWRGVWRAAGWRRFRSGIVGRASDDDGGGRLHQRAIGTAVRDIFPARRDVRSPVAGRRRSAVGGDHHRFLDCGARHQGNRGDVSLHPPCPRLVRRRRHARRKTPPADDCAPAPHRRDAGGGRGTPGAPRARRVPRPDRGSIGAICFSNWTWSGVTSGSW